MAQSRTYPLPSPAAAAAKIAAEGGPQIDPTQPTGKETADGITMSWEIAGGYITLTVDSKPWLIPYSVIWSHADAIFAN